MCSLGRVEGLYRPMSRFFSRRAPRGGRGVIHGAVGSEADASTEGEPASP